METFFESQTIEVGNGRAVTHAKNLRSTVLARFREANPATLTFCRQLIESAVSEGENVSLRVHRGAMEGFPASEVENVCRFLAEVTRGIAGFPEHYDWAAMTAEQKADFFDLEFSEVERLAYIVSVFVKFFAK
jgi:hypothetical protein